MREPIWVEKGALLLLHAKSLSRFGGLEGMRDEGLLETALARPQHAFHHDGLNDIAGLAASYAFGLTRNHPFADGNKRIAFLAIGLFLGSNGWELNAEPIDAIRAVLALASGEIGEGEFASWLRLHIRRL
ncbi:MAG TPA: type II toxin-antitoxin system death-on-curing family toxin [Rhizomicrobium sp.]|jgi:death-on-curing protein|nr:type II toxin-antitoxin system death-on-curing family toxin [Rhizomicrobium sp.]